MSQSETIPKGFESDFCTDGLRIRYRSHGTGCMVVFVVFSVGYVMAGVLYFAIHYWRNFFAFVFAMWWTPIAFAAGLCAASYFTFFVSWLLFGRTEFVATQDELVVRKTLFGLRRVWQVPRSEIKFFEQVKDGGEGDDSFPSWALFLHGRRMVTLLARQPREKSDWLGLTLARFYEVEFRASQKRK